MMSADLLNVMTVDELRNYAFRQHDLIGCIGDLLYAKNELIASLQRCYNDSQFASDRQKEYTSQLMDLRNIEDRLFQEHYNELPHPTPTCGNAREDTLCACEERRE